MRPNRNARSPDGYVEFGSIEQERPGRSLGTFAGVFSPVALSMFSALVFIRVGFIVGNAGLLSTLMQFGIAYVILLFTVASVCAISTNGEYDRFLRPPPLLQRKSNPPLPVSGAVEGGGVYFMISRTLGPEFGGSIGTLFFLANVVGCGLAVTGCAEGLIENFGAGGYLSTETLSLPDGRWWRFLYCSLITVVILVVCLVGASLFAKTSVAILGIVTVCLLSTYFSFLVQGPMIVPTPEENQLIGNLTLHYTGLSVDTFKENWNTNYGKDYSSGGRDVTFAITFGVLFSGVTGIMAGANMSGELKSPSRSIPIGTVSAVFFTLVCYIILSVLMAGATPFITLQNNFLVLMPVNIWPPFIAIVSIRVRVSHAPQN